MTSNGEEEGREEEEEVTTYRSTMEGGGPPSRHTREGGNPLPASQTTFWIFPPLMHLVQTRTRLVRPDTFARICTRFGSQRRFVCRFAWLTVLPTAGPFPQTSQR